MSGRRPDTTKVWEFIDSFRGVGANWTTFPEFFKNHGYLTLGCGKLFHPSFMKANVGFPNNDYPQSWSPEYPYLNGDRFSSQTHPLCLNNEVEPDSNWCAADVKKEDSVLQDQQIRDSCIKHLHLGQDSWSKGRPFFVGCGFHKPHTPWQFPNEFLHHYPDVSQIPLSANQFAPIGMPDMAWHPAADLGDAMNESPKFNGTCNQTRARLYRRAYYAAVSYTDYNIGRVLSALDQLSLTDSTAVVVFGDHGWHLGDQNTWAKQTNFEIATHTPLIIRAPWKESSVGKRTDVLAELVDVYPTLAALAGLPSPKSLGEELNGTSLERVFDDPSDIGVKDAAFSQFGKVSTFSVDPFFHRNQTKLMGYTVRTHEWRYTSWFAFDEVLVQPIIDNIIGRELYDHRGDTGLWIDFPGERVNLVHEKEHDAAVKSLHQRVLDYIQLKPGVSEPKILVV